jgi:hypothetical protein
MLSALVGVNAFVLLPLLLLTLPLWLIVFPVGLSTLLFLGTAAFDNSEYGDLYFGDDPELEEYARNRRWWG